ncbi:MAG: SDR family NAD(P)-dependent oxidoreductase [Candidatus Omnitrophota bacterium]
MFKRKKILITGATGFVGSNLLRYFIKEGADIYIFTRKESNKWRINDVLAKVKEFKVDLTDKDSLSRIVMRISPQIIMHTAVYGNFPGHYGSKRIMDVNLKGTVNLINSCKGIDFELFVNSGSSSEYGLKLHPMNEQDPLNPLGPYGASKAAAGLYAQKAAWEYNKPIVTLRLFSPYGYFEDAGRLIPSVILACLKGRKLQLSSPRSVRDFVFIEDVVDAYIKAFKNRKKISGGIFNIGSGSQHTIKYVVTKIISLTNSKIKPNWGSLDNLRVEPKRWQANIRKAKNELGWLPAYSLDKGLSKTISWFKHNIDLYN